MLRHIPAYSMRKYAAHETDFLGSLLLAIALLGRGSGRSVFSPFTAGPGWLRTGRRRRGGRCDTSPVLALAMHLDAVVMHLDGLAGLVLADDQPLQAGMAP